MEIKTIKNFNFYRKLLNIILNGSHKLSKSKLLANSAETREKDVVLKGILI